MSDSAFLVQLIFNDHLYTVTSPFFSAILSLTL